MYGASASLWAFPVGTVTAAATVLPAELVLLMPVAAGAAWYVQTVRLTRQAVARGRIERGQKNGRRVKRIRRRAVRAAVVVTEAGVWALMLDLVGWSPWAVVIAAAGLARWAIGATPRWREIEKRREVLMRAKPNPDEQAPSPAPAPADPGPGPEPDPARAQLTATWDTLLGRVGGSLAGTRLEEFEWLSACSAGGARERRPNWSARIVPHVPGSVNMAGLKTSVPGDIAAAYRCSMTDVSIVVDPSDVSTAHVRVQPDNPLAEVRMWPGASATDWDRGVSVVGIMSDGTPAEYVWWTRNGAAHDLFGGCSGSGKSELTAQLILCGLHSGGLVLDWLGDPQGGQSYGEIQQHVDWFARTLEEIKIMLFAAVTEMFRRNQVLSAAYIKTWQPEHASTLDMPLLVITLDEIQAYIADTEICQLVEALIGMGRKCGIKVRAMTQILAAYALGGSMYIKEQASTGQTVVFRMTTDQGGRNAVEGDVPINPTLIPETWGPHTASPNEPTAGLCFFMGLRRRDIYGRVFYTGGDMGTWLRPTTSPGVFSAEAQAASGPLWGDRHARSRLSAAAGQSVDALLPGGRARELIEAASVSSSSGGTAAADKPAQASARPGSVADQVMDVVRERLDDRGEITRARILSACDGLAPATVDKTLADLVADGRLVRVRNGVYALG
jgi:hypothetical protein